MRQEKMERKAREELEKLLADCGRIEEPAPGRLPAVPWLRDEEERKARRIEEVIERLEDTARNLRVTEWKAEKWWDRFEREGPGGGPGAFLAGVLVAGVLGMGLWFWFGAGERGAVDQGPRPMIAPPASPHPLRLP